MFLVYIFPNNWFECFCYPCTQEENHAVLLSGRAQHVASGVENPEQENSLKRTLELPTTMTSKKRAMIWENRLDDYTQNFPDLHLLRNTLDEKYPGKICFQLPRLGALSGNVLQHSSTQLEKLLQDEYPLIWKVGITHSPAWRWGNSLYGYSSAVEKWFGMIVLYISHEPYGPAMLEACLIDKFGVLDGMVWFVLIVGIPNFFATIAHQTIATKCKPTKTITSFPSVPSFVVQGSKQGCRNIRAGGETIHQDGQDHQMFMTYVVYRSLKCPPPIATKETLWYIHFGSVQILLPEVVEAKELLWLSSAGKGS